MRRLAVVTAVVAVLALTGCGEDPPDAATPPSPQPEDTVTRGEQRSPDTGGGGQHDAVTDARADLARRLGVDRSAISVVSAEDVTWRDGSMGCPRPGMLYPQVLTNGSRVVLEAEGRRYEYHAGGRRSAFLCENPEPPAER